MQDRYVGDVGDFAKYALLRTLAGVLGPRTIRLAVIWCRFPDESHNNDGRHVSYLRSSEFADLDPELWAVLNRLIGSGQRSVSAIAASRILPPQTIFYDNLVSLANIGLGSKERVRHRCVWLNASLRSTEGCDLVFFDPDNGLEVASVPKHHPKAGKYIYWDELALFWRRRRNALLLYHHLNRTVSAARQVEALTARFKAELRGAAIIPLVFRRGSSRVFWLIHNGSDIGRELESRAADLLSSGWSRHFRPFGWPGDDQAGTRAP
jgi:hypothetical protein